MSLESYIKKILNESTIDDDYASVTEIYEDDDMCCDDEWNDSVHSKLEAVKRVFVVRNGNITSIARSTRPGHKIAHGEERRMNFAERRARERAAEKTYARKKKHLSDKQQHKRLDSIEKRKDFGLDEE